ncbi:MAG TPA: carboxylating nicotinate-nucleotide diphosphorylase [Gemmatimonadaceae bacterium]
MTAAPPSGTRAPLGFPLSAATTRALVRAALDEDRAFADITTLATVPADAHGRAAIVARSAGVIAGLPLAIAAFEMLSSDIQARVVSRDGERVDAGGVVADVAGPWRALLSAERVALNFIQRLSGVATLTARYVDAVRGTKAHIYDTRKTTPTLRALEKYAVRCGGGVNHRADLAEAVLIKDNHLAALGGDVALAVHRAREAARPGICVEVECDDIAQIDRALAAGADVILLDNMSLEALRACVARAAGRVALEASGGVTLDRVRSIAETGVDRISVGSLTHSAPALDLGLDYLASPNDG